VQSSLNLIYLLGYAGPGNLRVFGKSNEKYRVAGGNDQIPTRLASALAGQITFGSKLVAVRRNTDGTYTLRFRRGGSTRTVVADRVVLALPFSILGSSVDLSEAGFSALKRPRPRSWGWARTRSSTCSSATGTGRASGRTARRSPTRATKTPGR
jgi:monoamine oxidase